MAHCIAEGLRAGHSFTESELVELQLSPVAFGDLVRGLTSNSGLVRLSLADCALGDDGIMSVLSVIRGSQLTTLELRSNQISNAGASSLAEALAGNATLRAIDLQRNDIKDQGAIGLAAALQVNRALQVVNLRFNEIGDSGATALGKALQGNRTILELHLGGNLIGPEGAMQIARCHSGVEPGRARTRARGMPSRCVLAMLHFEAHLQPKPNACSAPACSQRPRVE